MAQPTKSLEKTHLAQHNQPLQQKLFLFTSSPSKSKPSHFNPFVGKPSSATSFSPESARIHSGWRPRMPSKKAQDDPRFTLSLERRRLRLRDRIKNSSLVELQPTGVQISSELSLQMPYISARKVQSFIEARNEGLLEIGQAWEPNRRVPTPNFNMHYMIRKRRAVTPATDLEKNNNSLALSNRF